MQQHDFLVEIGTAELPAKNMRALSKSFEKLLASSLDREKIAFQHIFSFITPRRIAALITGLVEEQQKQHIEKIGPPKNTAFDDKGTPTKAAQGFAKSCQTSVENLSVKQTAKGEFLVFSTEVEGKKTHEILPGLVEEALHNLPMIKPMRWNNHQIAFIRPIKWITMLFGGQKISCQLMGQESIGFTYGHRFHHPEALTINQEKDYAPLLKEKGYVIADFNERKQIIIKQIEQLTKNKGIALVDEGLLDEVCGLVEWPQALLGKFDPRFLKVPPPAIILAMKQHQKCFPVVNTENQLQPYFITISNIQSKDPAQVITGNERVIHARLSDAEFFYHTDLTAGLEHYLQQLKQVIFQEKLGTLYDKAERLSQLTRIIANKLNLALEDEAFRAGKLAKADLMTEMVGEFPELQGTMGYYYALEEKEPEAVALAIKEQYLPRFGGDAVPKNPLGIALALADKLDTLVGIFGIHQAPTGEKDPFALRRAALGILRILIENEINLDLKELLQASIALYPTLSKNHLEETLDFILERLRAFYLEKGITPDVFAAVYARFPTKPFDFDRRIKAVQHFVTLPESQSLAQANKRVSNILKQTQIPAHEQLHYNLLTQKAEIALAELLEEKTKEVEKLCRQQNYQQALTLLASLRGAIDQFFDDVLVMVDDEAVKNNRLVLLNTLRNLFLQIADISAIAS